MSKARVYATLSGNLTEFLKGERTEAAKIITAAVNRAATGLRDELRKQVKANFRRTGRMQRAAGQNFVKTVRARMYPVGRKSMGAAGLVYFTASFMAAHIQGATIKAQGGRWLIIPLPEAVRRGYDMQEGDRSTFGRFTKGSNAGNANVAAATRDFGPLAFIQLPGGRALLAGNPARQNAKGRKSFTGTKLGGALVPLFILVPQVRLKPRIDVDGPARKALDRLYRDIARELG